MRKYTTTVVELPTGLFRWTLVGAKQNMNGKDEETMKAEGQDVTFELAMETASRVARKLTTEQNRG